jgi:SAM-dependent methyltransferase
VTASGFELYDPDDVLNRPSGPATFQHIARERELVRRRLAFDAGRVLSVGAGWHPGRHLFPAPAFELIAVDAVPERVAGVLEAGRADAAVHGYAGELDFPPVSFDVVLYRVALHHIAQQGPLAPVFEEAARLLRPGGALVAVEPGLWHPMGAGLALANRLGLGELVHGTAYTVALSPRALAAEARAAGLQPELHAVSYTWRRMPVAAHRAVARADVLGSRPAAARFGHTLMLIARRP